MTPTPQTIDATLSPSNNAEISPAAIAIWLAIQLITIGLIIGRIRLWIRGGDDADALSVMLIAQIAGASISAQTLMRNLRTAICVTMSALPFLLIAGIVSAADARQLVCSGAAVLLWMISLAMALVASRGRLGHAVIHALANCLSIGGVVVFYLRAEFAGQASESHFAWFGPIASALTLADRNSSPTAITRAWIALTIVAVFFFAVAIANRAFLIARARSA